MIEITQAKGERCFIIGDLHGCAQELEVLLNFLLSDQKITSKDLIVFLGDYIDRGPDSRAVVDLLVGFKAQFNNTIFLRGNHEDMLMDFLGYGGNLGHAFLYNGGLETIQSYGISVFSSPAEMMELLPESHFDFFCSLNSVVQVEGGILVHAGLNPKLKLTEQIGEDVFWIREPFLASPHDFGANIVFGHTPHREVFDNRPFKIGIDTGLVFGNKLSCLELYSSDIFQVVRHGKTVNVVGI